jgi:hypothetical protein
MAFCKDFHGPPRLHYIALWILPYGAALHCREEFFAIIVHDVLSLSGMGWVDSDRRSFENKRSCSVDFGTLQCPLE